MRLASAAVASAILAMATLAVPPRTTNGTARETATNGQDAVRFQSVSGKIGSVQSNSFTLEVNQNSSGQQFLQGKSHAATMTFLIDDNTTLDGKLRVGANAEVTYRQQNGNNVAVSVQIGT